MKGERGRERKKEGREEGGKMRGGREEEERVLGISTHSEPCLTGILSLIAGLHQLSASCGR